MSKAFVALSASAPQRQWERTPRASFCRSCRWCENRCGRAAGALRRRLVEVQRHGRLKICAKSTFGAQHHPIQHLFCAFSDVKSTAFSPLPRRRSCARSVGSACTHPWQPRTTAAGTPSTHFAGGMPATNFSISAKKIWSLQSGKLGRGVPARQNRVHS